MINYLNLDPYLHKKFVKSSGHGGQNVNKRNTKVQLKLDLKELWEHQVIAEEFYNKLMQKYPKGIIEVDSHQTRYQHSNLKIATNHLHQLVREVLENEV